MGHRIIAVFPLGSGELTRGFLGLCFVDDRKPTPSQIDFCRTLAVHATLAIRLERLAEQALAEVMPVTADGFLHELHRDGSRFYDLATEAHKFCSR